MADLLPEDVGAIQLEEAEFKSAVSEYFGKRAGKLLNYFREKVVLETKFAMNGSIKFFAGQSGVDGLFVFPYDATITDIIIYGESQGSGGTSEYDILLSPWNGGSPGAFVSVFTATPKITSAAAAYSTCGIGDTVSGCTAPVLNASPLNVNNKDRLRMDVPQMMSGDPKNGGIIIKFKPR